MSALPRGTRERLPNRRAQENQKASVAGTAIYVRSSKFKDGRPAEVFLRTNKEGTDFRTLMDAFGIALSIGLQYGVPLAEFVKAFRGVKFEPRGAVVGDPRITTCTSVLDYVVQELAATYPEKPS